MDYQSYYEKKEEKSDYEKAQELNEAMTDIAEGILTIVVGKDSDIDIVVTKEDDDEENEENDEDEENEENDENDDDEENEENDENDE